ncbi:MAG: formyltetrahydrofolate deformylase [Woeseiaceae bacterium]|nr:formyltetrahydrofolate deformylase [Woeseiaceae bacterium]
MEDQARYILKLSCDDRPGIVAAVSCAIFETGGNVVEAQQFEDHETGRFLMRVDFESAAPDKAAHRLASVFEQFNIRHELVPAARRGRVLIMVSKLDHCLHDLLYRWRKGGLKMDVVGVVSNHEHARALVEGYGLEYDVLPVTKENKTQQERKLLDIVDERGADLIVLARYMQILSDQLANRLYGRVINIHHSFLPSFKGARPYHQAHRRGVKLIGATAHYVTPDLDEGPIIEQEVARVKHSYTADDLVRIGRDTEARVLARAVEWHLDHRVFLNGEKTVVFA